MQKIVVSEPSQIASARRAMISNTQKASFSETDTGRAAIVATELANNLLRHGGGGELLIRRSGPDFDIVDIIALDKGPGMSDVQGCLRDGYSTAGSMGVGLGAVIRQSQLFDIFSSPGLGTAVLARLTRSDRPKFSAPRVSIGCVNLPLEGEEACGDDWAVSHQNDKATALLVVDGLGHGTLAASAAHEATRIFRENPVPPIRALEAIHAGLRHTRGAAVAAALIDLEKNTVFFCGIGNIAGAVIAGREIRRMISYNGIAGHKAHRIAELPYIFKALPILVILHSDGVASSWSLDTYPGLASRDASLIAAVLYRDFGRSRDDATILVVKVAAA